VGWGYGPRCQFYFDDFIRRPLPRRRVPRSLLQLPSGAHRASVLRIEPAPEQRTTLGAYVPQTVSHIAEHSMLLFQPMAQLPWAHIKCDRAVRTFPVKAPTFLVAWIFLAAHVQHGKFAERTLVPAHCALRHTCLHRLTHLRAGAILTIVRAPSQALAGSIPSTGEPPAMKLGAGHQP
jgi:hypothetical protein